MKTTIINITLLGISFLLLFGLAEWLYQKQYIKAEYTRKLVHTGTGMLTLLFPLMLDSHWSVLLLCSSFLAILIASQKLQLLESINGVDRKTYGSYLFPVIVHGCFLLQSSTDNRLLFYLPILILAISDPLAALVGKRFPLGRYTILGHTKTLIGSLSFFVSAFIVSAICLNMFPITPSQLIVTHSLMIALLTCVAEGISKDGFDNLTIPGMAALYLLSLNIPATC